MKGTASPAAAPPGASGHVLTTFLREAPFRVAAEQLQRVVLGGAGSPSAALHAWGPCHPQAPHRPPAPVSAGGRLRHRQLHQAHPDRGQRHHVLHPAAAEGPGGGRPSRAVPGDRKGRQGKSRREGAGQAGRGARASTSASPVLPACGFSFFRGSCHFVTCHVTCVFTVDSHRSAGASGRGSERVSFTAEPVRSDRAGLGTSNRRRGVQTRSPAFRVGLQSRSAGPEVGGSEYRGRSEERGDGDKVLSRRLEAFQITWQQI